MASAQLATGLASRLVDQVGFMVQVGLWLTVFQVRLNHGKAVTLGQEMLLNLALKLASRQATMGLVELFN